jgi:NTE family protein
MRQHSVRAITALAVCALSLGGCASKGAKPPAEAAAPSATVIAPATVPQPEVKIPPPRIALALGGGAAKGFAHIGVIKALESQGIHPDIVVGTSAGSVVGALYASGIDGFELQRIALDLKESAFNDWSLPDRGFLRGEALQDFINKTVQNRPLEKLKVPIGVVATDLQTGEPMVFQRGDTGMAVRASSTVPGLFQPVRINGHEYVDGGLASPLPVRTARRMGADIVIASDISAKPALRKVQDTIDVLLQTFAIMGNAIAKEERQDADVVIKPDISRLNSTDFESRHLAILEGERAGLAAIPALRQKIAEREARLKAAALQRPGPASAPVAQ